MGRNPQVLEDLLRERKVITAALTPLPEYSQAIVSGVASDLRRIDTLIEAHARVNGLDRMPAVDFAVLRVATWEMLDNADDVPRVIAIDEAVSIVKSISTDSSPAFVNAVLDAVRRDIESPAWRREHVIADEDVAEAEPESEAEDEEAVASPLDVVEADIIEADTTVGEETLTGSTDDQDDTVGAEAEVEAADAEGPPTEEPTEAAAGADTSRAKHPTIEDITAADLAELDEMLDEY